MNDQMKERPKLDEMTTEQPRRRDAEYVAAVNRGIAKAKAELEQGKGLTAEQFRSVFSK